MCATLKDMDEMMNAGHNWMSVHSVYITYWTASCRYTRLTLSLSLSQTHMHACAAKTGSDFPAMQSSILKDVSILNNPRPTSAGKNIRFEKGKQDKATKPAQIWPTMQLVCVCVRAEGPHCLSTRWARCTKQTFIHNSSRMDINQKGVCLCDLVMLILLPGRKHFHTYRKC